jgi:MoxR-like ATPase
MNFHIIDRIVHGYTQLEPVIIGLMAMNKSFMLIGRHGTGKTRLARALSVGFGTKGFVFYDATKDDLISIAGIPDPEAIKQGKLRFIPHERSIWDKSTIVVDEITRAGRENQNLWLEIIEDHSCFGTPLPYRTLIATANPESYAAAFKLDEALLDRFYAVIPVPESQDVSANDVQSMIELASNEQIPVSPEEIARLFVDIQRAYEFLQQSGARDRVKEYLSRFVPALLQLTRQKDGLYVSPRTYSRNLPEVMLSIAAYFLVAGSQEPLIDAAILALRYAVATKLQIAPTMLEQVHQTAAPYLQAGLPEEAEQLRLEMASLTSFESRLGFLETNWKKLQAILKPDELEKMLGELLRGATKKGEQEKLVALKGALEAVGYTGDALRQVDGRLLIALNQAINWITPKLSKLLAREKPTAHESEAIEQVRRFQDVVKRGAFFSNRSIEVKRLKEFLIDAFEGDRAVDDDSLVLFFRSLDIPLEQ